MKTLSLLSALLLAGIAAPMFAQAPAENIALNKKYTISKQPNYKLCTDEGDAVQLTDGKFAKGTIWVDKATVGWYYRAPVAITVDLEKTAVIGKAIVKTAGGSAGVTVPDHIYIFAGNDGKTWNYAGKLVNPDAGKKGYRITKMSLEGIKTEGRYIRFEVHTGKAYVFIDEVELFATAEKPVAASSENAGITNTEAFAKDLSKKK